MKASLEDIIFRDFAMPAIPHENYNALKHFTWYALPNTFGILQNLSSRARIPPWSVLIKLPL